MTEQQSRDTIKSHLREAVACCGELIREMDSLDLNDIDCQLDRAMRHLESAKTRLKNCDNF